MKTLLIQQGSGKAYADMLRLTAPAHREYAARHDIDLWTISGPMQTERAPVWDKTLLIRRALAIGGYELVVWADVDTMIVDRERDLREAADEFEHIGMTRHNNGWGRHKELGWHYNAGVIFIRPSLATIQAFDKVWSYGASGDNEDQSSYMDLWAECPGLYREIDYRWNAFAVAPHNNPTLLAWHGYSGDRLNSMRQALDDSLLKR